MDNLPIEVTNKVGQLLGLARRVTLLLVLSTLACSSGNLLTSGPGPVGASSSAGSTRVQEGAARHFGSYFSGNALVTDVTFVDCTLENSSQTQCYELLASSQPEALVVSGPFCPSTVTDEHGMFTWGGENPGLYALNQDFWEMVTALGYSFVNEDGTINVADPRSGGPGRRDVCLEAIPDDSYTLKMLIPITPEDLAVSTQLNTVSQVGVALDGVTIFGDAPTGNAIPALDPCGGHNDPSGYYHWHFGPDSIQENLDAEEIDLVCTHPQNAEALVGFACDGYAIYGPNDSGGLATGLDACSGHTGETREVGKAYHYHLTYESPNLPECRTGAVARKKLTSPDNPYVQLPDGVGPRGGGLGPGGVPPSFTEAAEALGLTVDELLRVLGPPPSDLETAAATLGIAVERLRAVLPPPPHRRP
jgi:hypothetical protein